MVYPNVRLSTVKNDMPFQFAKLRRKDEMMKIGKEKDAYYNTYTHTNKNNK